MAPDKNAKPDLILHDIVHYRQRFNWDCGVSCVLMVLPENKRSEFLENFSNICKEEGFQQSTWTIDLCYLLKRFNIKHHMYTTMLGVNEDYRRHRYYEKIIDLDRDRIRQRFAEAQSAGLVITQRAVSMDELLHHVRTRGPAIALVDAGLLVCDLCKHNKLKAEFRRWLGGSYRGHYVVVAGARGGRVLFVDPAARARRCAAPAARLAAACAAKGTDRDLILLTAPSSPKAQSPPELAR